jgi:hypothetical protein
MLHYNMGLLPVKNSWEHIALEYEGGEMVLRFREHKQVLKIFKRVERYGENKVVVSSSGWYEHQVTIERGETQFFCMLTSGALLRIGPPRYDNQYGDDSVVLKITNLEGQED